MNYKEKQKLIFDGVERLKNGLSWENWNKELRDIDRFFKKDMNIINRKVIGVLEEEYAPLMQRELLATGGVSNKYKFADDLFVKLYDRTLQITRNKLINDLTKKISQDPDNVEQILLENQYAFLDKDDYQKSIDRAAGRLIIEDEITAQKSPVNLVFGVLLVVIGGAASALFTDIFEGTTIFVGLILAGLFLLAKYFIGIYQSA